MQWEVRRQNGGQAPYPTVLRFPAAPPGHVVVQPTQNLEPGRYAVSADGGIAHFVGNFKIPGR